MNNTEFDSHVFLLFCPILQKNEGTISIKTSLQNPTDLTGLSLSKKKNLAFKVLVRAPYLSIIISPGQTKRQTEQLRLNGLN